MAEQAELQVLEHLGYVLECLAENVRGDAKSELDGLARALESDPRYAIEDREEKAVRINEALRQLRSDDALGAAARLSKVNRELWKRVLSAENG